MAGLIQPELVAAGDLQTGQKAPAHVLDRARELDATRFELRDGRVDVVAHEVQLVA